jgi:hypothetical protein
LLVVTLIVIILSVITLNVILNFVALNVALTSGIMPDVVPPLSLRKMTKKGGGESTGGRGNLRSVGGILSAIYFRRRRRRSTCCFAIFDWFKRLQKRSVFFINFYLLKHFTALNN